MASTTTGITLGFWDKTIGKKAVMAVCGVVLSGFVIAHYRRSAERDSATYDPYSDPIEHFTEKDVFPANGPR